MSRWVVEADGGSRGNPGPAGCGALVRDATGEVLAEVAEGIGRASNNVAEYRGLVAGLEAATELCRVNASCGRVELEIRMDSKLVVEQMSGRWKIKHPDLRPLARQAAKLADAFGGVSYQWVPRERNAHADRLANDAMDAAAAGRSWSRHETARPEVAKETPETASSARTGERTPQGRARERAPQDRTDERAPQSRTTGWMAPSVPPTIMVLLRHGETALSGERRFSGAGPADLTPAGVEQAQAAARQMLARSDIDAIASSPLPRARQTADVVAGVLGLPVVTVDGFRETDFGAWEGYTFAEVRERWADELNAWLADPAVAPPGGESFAATAERVGEARDSVVERYPEGTVLVVSHVTPIKTLVRQALLAPPEALYRLHLDVASVCEVQWYADGPALVRSLNDTRHL